MILLINDKIHVGIQFPVLKFSCFYLLNRVRSRRPPTFQDSNLGSQEVSSLPVRRTVGGNSERIQVCNALIQMVARLNFGENKCNIY